MEHHAAWWDVRMARNPSGAIYTCPLCGGPVHSATEHMLITPQGEANRRRHAHTECVRAAIRAGELRSRNDVESGSGGRLARWRKRRLMRR